MLAKIKGAVQGWMAGQQEIVQHRSNLRGYAHGLGRMLMDLDLSPQELASLKSQQSSLGLDPAAVHKIHRDAFAHLSTVVLQDGVVTEDEIQMLSRIGTALAVDWKDLPPLHLQTYQVAHSCIGIQKGELPALPSNQSSLREGPGEIVHAEVHCLLLDEVVVRREYVGSSRGASVRICKGVSYRFGSTRGHSIPVKAVVPVDHGTFTISNQRLVFSGAKKSFAVAWPKVLTAETYSDGVHLAFQSRSKSATLQYSETPYSEVLSALLTYYMR